MTQSASNGRSKTQQALSILIIENDGDLTLPAHHILTSPSNRKLFKVHAARTPKEALNGLSEIRPALILLDSSPGDDPELTVFSRIASHTEVPLVALLGDEDQGHALRLVQAGAQAFILKSQLDPDTFPAFLLQTIHAHASERALKASEERFRLMIENASDLITALEPSGLITFAGPSSAHILDYRDQELTGQNVLDLIHRDDRRKFLDQFEKAFKDEDRLHPVQFRLRHAKGGWLHMEGRGRVVGQNTGKKLLVLNSHDVSHRVKLENELRSMSFRDELTGLHNRRSFMAFFEQELKIAQREKRKEPLNLLFIDLDKFKWINDNLGHKEGDNALIAASEILKTTFREADIIARLGGDEFVVLLANGFHEENVGALKKRLFENLEEWNQKENREYSLLMSLGILPIDPRRNARAESLLAEADELMYQEKKSKKATAR